MLSTIVFINIGPNLSKTIPDSSKPFKSSLKNISLNKILLDPSREDEIYKILPLLNKGKVLGSLRIPVTIRKDNVNVLSNPLSFIINPISIVKGGGGGGGGG